MPSGTEIKVFVPRLHIINAETKRYEAEISMQHVKQTLVWLAARTPNDMGCMESTLETIEQLLDEYADASTEFLFASEVLLHPEDCEDELA